MVRRVFVLAEANLVSNYSLVVKGRLLISTDCKSLIKDCREQFLQTVAKKSPFQADLRQAQVIHSEKCIQ